MTAAAWKPATVFRSTSDVELWNAILPWAGEALHPTPGVRASFALAEAPDPRLRAHHLRLGGRIDLVAAPLTFPFEAMFGADFDVDELERLPPALASRLDQAVIDVLWRCLPDTHLAAPTIRASGPVAEMSTAAGQSVESDRHWFTADVVGLANGSGEASLLVGAALRDVVELVAGGRVAARTVPSALAMRITAPVTRRIDTMAITADELARLRPGDVIVLDEAAATEIRLCGQGWEWHLQPHDGGYAIVHAGPQANETVAEGVPAMAETTLSQSLTFDLRFEIGRFDVPIGALDAWRPGTVVTFEPPQAANGATVTLTVNGRDIGHGDLIGVDDRLAVRITHLIGATAG